MSLETPIEGGHGGCLSCGTQYAVLPLDAPICVGFGSATITRNGEIVYDGEDDLREGREPKTCADAEKMAMLDPESDWRIHLVAPLSERHYQRQGPAQWVLYEKGEGFA